VGVEGEWGVWGVLTCLLVVVLLGFVYLVFEPPKLVFPPGRYAFELFKLTRFVVVLPRLLGFVYPVVTPCVLVLKHRALVFTLVCVYLLHGLVFGPL
jgi:hypothetical protein